MRLVQSFAMAGAGQTRAFKGSVAWLLVGLVVCVWLVASPLQAGAAEETPAADVPVPAVPVPDDPPAEPEPEWSYRFLVPATLLLGTAAVVGAIIMYFVRVTKNRYRVIR
ncbi:hypothetical protein [Candidatus Spongiisocius sp.]|uniref:hypothetical protein n=1 Tax=Candidatus Spongiisocius sp. TaxID=3101273 RepID=UPI003B593F85